MATEFLGTVRLRYPDMTQAPRITCVMSVSDASTAAAVTAARSYLRQTYPNKELIIIASAPDPALTRYLDELGRPDILLVRSDVTDGRRFAADKARGPLVCHWSAGDLHDDRRLEIQYEALRQTGARSCVLEKSLIWSPAARKLGVGRPGGDQSMLYLKRAPTPDDAEDAEDTAERSSVEASVVRCDMPRLLVHLLPATAAAWGEAETIFDDGRYDAVLAELAKRLPIEEHMNQETRRPAVGPSSDHPPVLVLTPVKNARRHLARYGELLSGLTYDHAALSVGFLEGDSDDGTPETLAELVTSLRGRFRKVDLFRHDYGLRIEGERTAVGLQRRRREIIARARNRLLTSALGDEAWVLWLDADLVDYPADLLLRLLSTAKDIVVPHCILPHGATFDLNTFRFSVASGGRDDARHLVDGLFQPPRGHHRLYLDSFRMETLVPIDSVGGTALLVRADLHREGLIFPPFSYRGYIETEGLAMMAKDMGHQSWGMPQLRIVHAAE